MTITITQLYQLLSKKLNQETAEALTTYISEYVTENVKEEVDTKVKTLATKEDLAQTKLDLIKCKPLCYPRSYDYRFIPKITKEQKKIQKKNK